MTHEDERVRFMDLNTFIKKYVHEENLVCIGGKQIYTTLLPYFDEIYWNELRLNEVFHKEVYDKFDDKVYLGGAVCSVIDYPSRNGYKEGASVMQIDKLGNVITYKRYTKRATY